MNLKNKKSFTCLLLLVCSTISLIYALWYGHLLYTLINSVKEQAKEDALIHTQTSVTYIDNLLDQAEKAVEQVIITQDSQLNITPKLLQQYKPNAVSGLGYASLDDNSVVDGYYYVEYKDTQQLFSLKENRTEREWNPLMHVRQHHSWSGPFKDPYTGQQVFIYVQKIAPNHIVWATQSIEHLAHLLYTTQTKDISYWLIIDAQNTINYAPFPEMQGNTLDEATNTINIPKQAINTLMQAPLSTEHATLQDVGTSDNKSPLWVTAQKMKKTNTTLIGVYSEADLPLPRDIIRQNYFHCIAAFTLALALILLALLVWYWPQQTRVWICDLLIALTFIIATATLWAVAHNYPYFKTNATPIFSKTQLYRYLDQHQNTQKQNGITQEPSKHLRQAITNADELYYLLNYRYKKGSYVPTGVLVHDISFESSDQIGIVGYVWQRYFDGIHDTIKRGFMFPQLGDTPTITEISRSKEGKAEIILWHVSVTLNQTISYQRYPFDVKNLSIELRHKDFEKQVTLVPDFDAYYLLNPTALPGVSPYSHLSNWAILSSFFGFTKTSLNTNFGIYAYGPYGTYYALDTSHTPSLTFNVAIQRNIWNAIIDNLLMLAVIYLILFVLLITYAIQSFGWTLGTCTSIFFTTILAQIRFRSEIPSHEIVYFESFYFVLYTTVVTLLLFSLIGFYINAFDHRKRQENQVIKLLYWPLTLGILTLATIFKLY